MSVKLLPSVSVDALASSFPMALGLSGGSERGRTERVGLGIGSWTFSGRGPRQMMRDGSMGVRWMAPGVVDTADVGDGAAEESVRFNDEAYV